MTEASASPGPRRWRWFLLGILGAILGLALVLVLILPRLVDADRYRGRIEQEAETRLGRDVRMGEISLAMWPSLALEVEDFAIAGAPGEAADLLSAGRLRVFARWFPLLSKRLEVTSLVLEEPRLFLRRDAGGRWNVEDLGASEDRSQGGAAAAAGDSGGAFSLELLRLRRAQVLLEDAAGAPGETLRWHLEPVDLTLRGLAPGKQVRLEAEGAMRAGVDGSTPGTSAAGDFRMAVDLGSWQDWGDSPPTVAGDLRLEGATLTLPGARRPIEEVQATVLFAGGGLEVEDFAGRVGGSDLAGRLSVADLENPAVSFVLSSTELDFLEVFEALPGDEEGEVGTGAETAAEPLPLSGQLRVGFATLENLDLSNLEADLSLVGERLSLEPVGLELYYGRFDGQGGVSLATTAAADLAFRLEGRVDGVDVDRFLADNLDLGGLLFGAFSGDVRATGSGLEASRLLRTLDGGGAARVEEGRLGKLDVLASLSQISGVFGEKSLARLTRQLSTEGTEFSSLDGEYLLEGGRLRLPEVRLASPDFDLEGRVVVDLTTLALEGAFTVTFSSALSRSMYEEGSRAGELFWDPQLDRVAVPLALSGPMEAPEATLDWKAAVQGTVRREVGKTLSGLLEEALGGREAPAETSSALGSSEPVSRELRAEVTEVRWGGNLLIRDLKLRGFVSGADLQTATLEVMDAQGGTVERWEQLGQLREYLESAVDPAAPARVGWDSTFKGRDLLATPFPLTVTLTVKDTAGQEVQSVRTVHR